ncbi:MAG: LysM peptidoglycan-binding domain-containing protein [Acidimicrobiales bacterium]
MTMTATLPLSGSTPAPTPRQRAAHHQAQHQLFLRRRLAALTLLVVLVALVALVLGSTRGVQADDGSAPITGHPVEYVVAPGDSLWSIASELAPDADPRPIVRELEASAGGAVLQVGQLLIIPADLAR